MLVYMKALLPENSKEIYWEMSGGPYINVTVHEAFFPEIDCG